MAATTKAKPTRAKSTDKKARSRRSFGSIERKPSGKYRASYVGLDGVRYAAIDTFDTSEEAEGWLGQVRTSMKMDKWKPPSVLESELFGIYAPLWVVQRVDRDGKPLAPRTHDDYEAIIERRGLAYFADMRMSDITPAVVRAWHARRCAEAGPTSAGNEARILRAILNTALDDKLIESNPVPKGLTKSSTGLAHRNPTNEEVAKMLGAITPRFKLALQMALFGGLRIGEWRALKRESLVLVPDGYYVVRVLKQAQRVKNQKTGKREWVLLDPKSANGKRIVALPKWMTADVASHLEKHVDPEPDALLFPSGGTGDYADQAWRNAWDIAREAAGLKGLDLDAVVRGHDNRHYYATSLVQKGATAPQLQSALGHGTITMSMKYVHDENGIDIALANLLEMPKISDTNDKNNR